MQRHQANYYGDQTDVRNPETGQAYKVGSGYSNYYHDPRTGAILGTNSTDRPPVDFIPLEQFLNRVYATVRRPLRMPGRLAHSDRNTAYNTNHKSRSAP